MLIIEDVEIRWHGSNRKHFESLGYVFTTQGDTFTAKATELPEGSNIKIKVLCDYCETNISLKRNKAYVIQMKTDTVKKDSCKSCVQYKRRDVNLIKYGVEWITQTEEFKEKTKETHMKNFGVEFYSQTEEFEEKRKATNLKNLGVEYTLQDKSKLEKRRQTFIKNFGVDHPMRNQKHKEKVMEILYKSEGVPASRQQKHIHNLVGGELNYPVAGYFLDVAFVENKTYLEYDGGGHDLQVKFGNLTQEEFEIKERKRSLSLYRKDWKEIRILSEVDKLPEDFVIVKFVDKARSFFNDGKVFSVQYCIDTNKVIINYKHKCEIDEFLSKKFTVDKIIEVA